MCLTVKNLILNVFSALSLCVPLREKLCAFCYCGEKSLLGQGELKLFGPTPGYVPLHIRNRRGSSEKDDDYHDEDNDFDDNDNNQSPGHREVGLKKWVALCAVP